MIDILLPELGEGISNVEIRDVLVKKGDSIKKDQVILVLETDKASMEIPSEHDGVISELYIKTGDKISPNEKILTLNSEVNDSLPLSGIFSKYFSLCMWDFLNKFIFYKQQKG